MMLFTQTKKRKNSHSVLGFLFVVFFGIICFSQPSSVSAVDCSSIPTSGNYTVSSACSFPGTVNGIDAGSGTTNTAVLTVGTGGTLSVLSDQTLALGSITMSGGSITLIGTGSLKIGTPLYLPDADGDGYPTSVTTTQYIVAAANRARRSHTADANDAQACADGANPGTCQKCATGAIVNQTISEDLFSACTASYNACSGACVKIGPNGNCNGSGACDTNSASANVADQKVCEAQEGTASEVAASTFTYASIANSCTAGACAGTKYYRACNGAGATRTDNIGAASKVINATAGNTLTGLCGSSTASTCVARAVCKTNTYCNGTGACNTPANVAVNTDTYNDCAAGGVGSECGTGNCNGAGACSGIDPGFEGSTCPVCKVCGGGTTCVNVGNNTQDTVGINLCNTTCKACQSGSCGNADAYTDPGNQCPEQTNKVVANSGTGKSCTTLCGENLCPSGNCSASGACGAGGWCVCKSVGTEAGGGTNTYAMAEDCVQYSGKTCALVLTNMSVTCSGRAAKWTNCKCAYQ